MKEYIAFDSHKHYTLAERENVRTGRCRDPQELLVVTPEMNRLMDMPGVGKIFEALIASRALEVVQ
jgi:hypothetical protein